MRACRAYLSLMARTTLYKELLLFVWMAVVELALVLPKVGVEISTVVGMTGNGEEILETYLRPIQDVVEGSNLGIVWLLSLLALSLILILTAGQWRDDTLDRLGLSRKGGNLLCGLYCALAFVLLWAFQGALVLGLCLAYRQSLPPEQVTAQTVLLSIYRTPVFYTVLPLANGLGWIANGSLMAALGLCAANGARLRRLGRYPSACVGLLMVLFVFGYGRVGLSDGSSEVIVLTLAFCFGATAVARMTLWDNGNREGEDDEPLDAAM